MRARCDDDDERCGDDERACLDDDEEWREVTRSRWTRASAEMDVPRSEGEAGAGDARGDAAGGLWNCWEGWDLAGISAVGGTPPNRG